MPALTAPYTIWTPDQPAGGAHADQDTGDISAVASSGFAGQAYPVAGVGAHIRVPGDVSRLAVFANNLVTFYNCSARSYLFGYANAAAHIKLVLWRDGTQLDASTSIQDLTLYDAHGFEETHDQTRPGIGLSAAVDLPPRGFDIQTWNVCVYVAASAFAAGAAGADARCSTRITGIDYEFFWPAR